MQMATMAELVVLKIIVLSGLRPYVPGVLHGELFIYWCRDESHWKGLA